MTWDNVDLWVLLQHFLRIRLQADFVRLIKVKGHATSSMISKGEVTERDKRGNDAADAPAPASSSEQVSPAKGPFAALAKFVRGSGG